MSNTSVAPPTFAVVIPTYNRAELVLKTLDSVFAQRRAADEVIVVDNASTDDTEARLAPLAEAGRITYIRHPVNRERAASRNTGMGAATADWVTFLDSDDLMYPDALADAEAFAIANPRLRVFQNRYELVDEAGTVLHRHRFPSLRDPRRAIADGNFMSCIGDFLHRDLYTRYAFDVDGEVSGAEDWLFWIRVLADHEVGRIEKINSGIVDHSGRTLAAPDLDQATRRIRAVVARVHEDPHLAERYRRHLRLLDGAGWLFLASLANGAGRHRAARGFLARGARTDPRAILSLRFVRTAQLAARRDPA